MKRVRLKAEPNKLEDFSIDASSLAFCEITVEVVPDNVSIEGIVTIRSRKGHLLEYNSEQTDSEIK